MGGIVIDIWEKSVFWGSIGSQQDKKSNGFDSISNNGCFRLMILTESLSYPQSRDAIASKKVPKNLIFLLGGI